MLTIQIVFKFCTWNFNKDNSEIALIIFRSTLKFKALTTVVLILFSLQEKLPEQTGFFEKLQLYCPFHQGTRNKSEQQFPATSFFTFTTN